MPVVKNDAERHFWKWSTGNLSSDKKNLLEKKTMTFVKLYILFFEKPIYFLVKLTKHIPYSFANRLSKFRL